MHKIKTVSAMALLAMALGMTLGGPAHAQGVGMTQAGGVSINNASNINVQTNIAGSHQIDDSSNVSVNTTINGVAIGYGLNGANVLDVVNAATAEAAGVHAGYQANAQTAMQVGMMVEQMRN